MLQVLENRIAGLSLDGRLRIIILGGAFENEVISGRGGVEFNQAADRFVEGLSRAGATCSRKLLSRRRWFVPAGDDGDARPPSRSFPPSALRRTDDPGDPVTNHVRECEYQGAA